MLQWLELEFIGWLDEWEAQVKAIPDLTPDDIEHCLLSRATREGWRITVASFIALCRELLSEGYQFVVSKKLVCQDIVEQFFARHRQSCGGNSAPTLHDMINNTHLFRMAKHVEISKNTNSESGDGQNELLDIKRRKR